MHDSHHHISIAGEHLYRSSDTARIPSKYHPLKGGASSSKKEEDTRACKPCKAVVVGGMNHYCFGVRTSSGLHTKYYYFETLTL